ncbi:hypothetical protein ACHAWO_003305 [Cyclotella atomus]|uniref:Uncharacterized protein n=1 Tax=Cyclotella atomus TaxID=382360 RepID=A0ABD3NYC8_9STRA
MKTISILCLLASTAQSFMIGSSIQRAESRLYNLDKSFENQLKTEYPDASRATILECDDENCVQVQCVQMPNGEWKCDEGLEGNGATSKTVLMVSEDDD